MTPEGKVKAKVKKTLDNLHAYYFMPATGGYGRSGVPDFIGCIDGVFFAVECKADGNKPTALQEREMRLIGDAGGKVLVIDETNVSFLATLLLTNNDRSY